MKKNFFNDLSTLPRDTAILALAFSGSCQDCLSLLYMTTGKTIALTVQPFVGKVMSLLFNMLSRFVIALTFIFLLFLYFDFDFFIFIPIPCFAKYLPHVPTVPGIKVLSLFAIAWTI